MPLRPCIGVPVCFCMGPRAHPVHSHEASHSVMTPFPVRRISKFRRCEERDSTARQPKQSTSWVKTDSPHHHIRDCLALAQCRCVALPCDCGWRGSLPLFSHNRSDPPSRAKQSIMERRSRPPRSTSRRGRGLMHLRQRRPLPPPLPLGRGPAGSSSWRRPLTPLSLYSMPFYSRFRTRCSFALPFPAV